jgi:hypothetical protein
MSPFLSDKALARMMAAAERSIFVADRIIEIVGSVRLRDGGAARAR